MKSVRRSLTAGILALLFSVSLASLFAAVQAAEPASKPEAMATPAQMSQAAAADKLDINTATADQLKALPDIGDVGARETSDPDEQQYQDRPAQPAGTAAK